ncbi:hypothetical protein T492DRAFT_900809 [Pavlovales sp. CCMP2436]|nr:hypothetical protein T492DRAFT_900809 [Pavlovales sp. CCMP2436]
MCQSFHYTVNFDWPIWGAGLLNWKIALVKMAPRVSVITTPEQAILVSLWPYSATANGTGYVRMTEKVQGKMDSDFGRVIWTKKVPCFKDTLDLGQYSGKFPTAFSQVSTGSSSIGNVSLVQRGRRTMMNFNIKVAKNVYDSSAIASVESAFPKYRLFLYQADCMGFLQASAADTSLMRVAISFPRPWNPVGGP